MSRFKVDDKVRVVRKVGEWEGDYWVKSMDKFLGRVYEIYKVVDTGYLLDDQHGNIYCFPDESLELADAMPQFQGYKPVMGIYKLRDDVQDPRYATEGSAYFDIKLNFENYKLYSPNFKNPVEAVGTHATLQPRCRGIFGTGLILDIPEGYYLDIQVRSSTGIKHGLRLSNVQGIIDSDYVNELFISLQNTTNQNINISSGDCWVQGSLKRVEQVKFKTLEKPPEQKTSRNGGIGSTSEPEQD